MGQIVSRFNVISIHAPRVGGDPPCSFLASLPIVISIHAPRVGGDLIDCPMRGIREISIHAPRVGGDKTAKRKRPMM